MRPSTTSVGVIGAGLSQVPFPNQGYASQHHQCAGPAVHRQPHCHQLPLCQRAHTEQARYLHVRHAGIWTSCFCGDWSHHGRQSSSSVCVCGLHCASSGTKSCHAVPPDHLHNVAATVLLSTSFGSTTYHAMLARNLSVAGLSIRLSVCLWSVCAIAWLHRHCLLTNPLTNTLNIGVKRAAM